MTCKTCQKRLSAYLDHELPAAQRREFDRHVQSCTACSEALHAMEVLVGEAAAMPDKNAPAHLWPRIAAALDESEPHRSRHIPAFSLPWRPRWSAAMQGAFALVILAFGVFIGRYSWQPQDKALRLGSAAPDAVAIAALERRAATYFERSKVLLIGIANLEVPADAPLDLGVEKALSANLLREAAYLQEHLPVGKNERLRRLVVELELILWEITNLEAQADSEHIELLKTGIERTDLLFKINLNGLSEDLPAPAAAAPDRQL